MLRAPIALLGVLLTVPAVPADAHAFQAEGTILLSGGVFGPSCWDRMIWGGVGPRLEGLTDSCIRFGHGFEGATWTLVFEADAEVRRGTSGCFYAADDRAISCFFASTNHLRSNVPPDAVKLAITGPDGAMVRYAFTIE